MAILELKEHTNGVKALTVLYIGLMKYMMKFCWTFNFRVVHYVHTIYLNTLQDQVPSIHSWHS